MLTTQVPLRFLMIEPKNLHHRIYCSIMYEGGDEIYIHKGMYSRGKKRYKDTTAIIWKGERVSEERIKYGKGQDKNGFLMRCVIEPVLFHHHRKTIQFQKKRKKFSMTRDEIACWNPLSRPDDTFTTRRVIRVCFVVLFFFKCGKKK